MQSLLSLISKLVFWQLILILSEEKCEQIESLKDEVDEVKKQIHKLRNENGELQQKATLANVYSDELESLRYKSLKVDRYESEIGKLKERIDELQESKSRLEVCVYNRKKIVLLDFTSFSHLLFEIVFQILNNSNKHTEKKKKKKNTKTPYINGRGFIFFFKI